MVTAMLLALAQLPERDMRRPLVHSALWTMLLFVLLFAGGGWTLHHYLASSVWLEALAAALGAVLAYYCVMWLFPTVGATVLSFYSEAIIVAVERRHYPDLPPAGGTRLLDGTARGLRLAFIGLLLNIIALPFYLLVPGANLALFLALNGYLLGREYFDVVALRRMDSRGAQQLWRDFRMDFVLSGAAVAALFLVPVANVVAPMIGLATTVHLVERRVGRAPGRSGGRAVDWL